MNCGHDHLESSLQLWAFSCKKHTRCSAVQCICYLGAAQVHDRLLHSEPLWEMLVALMISSGQMFVPFCYILIFQVGGKSRCYYI